MTCCVKNWVRFIPQDVRLRYHRNPLQTCGRTAPGLAGTPLLWRWYHRWRRGRPGFVAPSFSRCAARRLNDPVAIDSVGSELLNVSRNELVFPWTAYFEGVGEIGRGKILDYRAGHQEHVDQDRSAG